MACAIAKDWTQGHGLDNFPLDQPPPRSAINETALTKRISCTLSAFCWSLTRGPRGSTRLEEALIVYPSSL